MVKFYLIILFSTLVIISKGAGTTFTVNSLTDANTGAGTSGDLRYCITQANLTAGASAASPHTINFSVSGTITLTSNLPTFAIPIYINGSTSTGYTARTAGSLTTRTPGTAGTLGTPAIPTITIVGYSFLLNNSAANGSRIRGLAITNANPHAFDINSVNTLIIEECNIGINAAGTSAAATAAHGILINNSTGTIIRNNIISGSGAHGILTINCPNMYIYGNFIGCNRAGTSAVANNNFGILLLDASNNVRIGGLSSDSSNLISGNSQIGIGAQGSTKSNIYIINNLIGVTKAGTAALGNQFGINAGAINTFYITNNVVSASTSQGIYIELGSGLVMKGNFVGTNVTGTTSIKNGSNGVDLNETHGAIIGGKNAGEGNVFSGTNNPWDHGIILQGGARTNNCIIKGNYMGTNVSGQAITGGGNGGYGIVIKGSNNILGGTAAGESNIISGNGGAGVLLTDGSGNQVIGNLIGVSKTLTSLGNGYAGVLIRREDASFSTINNIVRSNTIANNGYSYPVNPSNSTWISPNLGPGIGVSVAEYGTSNIDAIQNTLAMNSIYCNAGLGISLNKLETTPGYGNINKVSPVIDNSTSTNTVTNGTAAANDSIEVYANTITTCGCQAEILLGKTKANGSGVWTLTHASYNYLYTTAIARDASNNTSEISKCQITLPINLLSFKATAYQTNISLIEWQTATEINNDYFTIEKSTDGIHFYSIGKAAGNGNSSVIINYSLQDKNFIETSFYRLKQTDLDGKFTYSPIVMVNFFKEEISIYPNPATELINISGNIPAGSEVRIVLYNNLSQEVEQLDLHNQSDFFKTAIFIGNLPSAIYTLNIISSDKTWSKKIIKQ